jgi:2-polyprenyl-3-methyl-5-hydroxy-6-metoxy-1,4-benzoquinol methylase
MPRSVESEPRTLRAFYEESLTSHRSGRHRAKVELELLDQVRAGQDGTLRVLDVGAGDGWLAAQVAQRLKPAYVSATDLSMTAAAGARERGLDAIVASTDGGALPVRSGSLDVLIMSEVIEHLVDTDGAMDEAYRVLSPGGHLVLSTPNLAAWFNRVLLAVGIQPVFSEVSRRKVYGRPGSEVAGHLQLFTARALREFVGGHGFTVLQMRGAAYHDVPRTFRPVDHALTRWTAGAAILLVLARKPE